MHEHTQRYTESEVREHRDTLRLITAGSVDDGKSTLIGRLLFDSKAIFEDQLEQITNASIRRGDERTNLALLTDGLRAEREQGITIDVAYRYFATPRRKFIIADVPGHAQYTRNMVTGASTANLAILLVDARKGALEQSRRHAFVAAMLGIPHLVVAINKMDLVEYSQAVFEKIQAEMTDWFAKLRIRDVHFIPINAVSGDNVVERSTNLPWYRGTTLLEYLETVHIASDRNLVDTRFPVQWVIRPESDNHSDYRGYAGVVAGGIMKVGDEIAVLPSGRTTSITRIESCGQVVSEAFPPMSVTIHLEQKIDCSRGSMFCRPDNFPVVSDELDATVVWMGERPFQEGNRYRLKHTTRWVRATVMNLHYELDVTSLSRNKDVQGLTTNCIGRCRLVTTEPLYFDPYEKNRVTGSFILVDEVTNETVGAGMLLTHNLKASHRGRYSLALSDGNECGIFVTSTDGGRGSSRMTRVLRHAFLQAGFKTAVMKLLTPVLSDISCEGFEKDAMLGKRDERTLSYQVICPPSSKAEPQADEPKYFSKNLLSFDDIEILYREVRSQSNKIVVEGFGGWKEPISSDFDSADIAKRLGLAVVMVVNVRRGCLSSAILTAQSIRADGLSLIGWSANCSEENAALEHEYIELLKSRLAAPFLGVLSYRPGATTESIASELYGLPDWINEKFSTPPT